MEYTVKLLLSILHAHVIKIIGACAKLLRVRLRDSVKLPGPNASGVSSTCRSCNRVNGIVSLDHHTSPISPSISTVFPALYIAFCRCILCDYFVGIFEFQAPCRSREKILQSVRYTRYKIMRRRGNLEFTRTDVISFASRTTCVAVSDKI